MKRALFAMLLLASNTHAMDPSTFVMLQVTIPSMITEMNRQDRFANREPVTVTAVGTGKTCDSALENSKTIAIEKAVGVWIHGEKTVNQNVYNEKIVEYSGALIKSYTVLRNECTTVEIEALVVPRNNKITTGSANVPQQSRDQLKSKIENEKKRQLAIKEVNDRSRAISFEIKDIELQPNRMIVVGQMAFQEKWKHDYNDLRNQAGEFTLDSFHKPIHLRVKGYTVGKEIFNARYQLNYDKVELYRISSNGNVTIYPNKTDTIRLTFPIDSGRIMDVDKFEVSIL